MRVGLTWQDRTDPRETQGRVTDIDIWVANICVASCLGSGRRYIAFAPRVLACQDRAPSCVLCDDGLPRRRACEDPIAAMRLGGEQRRVGVREQPLIVKLGTRWTGRDAHGHRHR